MVLITTALPAADEGPVEPFLLVRPYGWALPAQRSSKQVSRLLDAVIELAAGNESAIVVDPRWWTVIAGSMDFESFSGVHCLEAGGGRILLTLYGSPDSADVAFTFVGLELQSLCRIPPIVQGDDGPLDQKRAELRRIRDGLDRRLQERSFGSAVTTLRAATR